MDDDDIGGVSDLDSSPSGRAAVSEVDEKEEDSSTDCRGDSDGDAEGGGCTRVERGRDGALTDTARIRRGGGGGGVVGGGGGACV